MTDQNVTEEDQTDAENAEATDEEGGASSKRLSGKKIVLFFILPVLVVVGAAAGVYMSGIADPYLSEYLPTKAGDGDKGAKPVHRRTAVFFDLPELLVNLNSTGRRTNFLKISISLELNSKSDAEKLELLLPRIIDSFQVYLRELRVNDLRGSAGVYRLREDLLRRVSEAARPVKVNDVLFKEMLVQ